MISLTYLAHLKNGLLKRYKVKRCFVTTTPRSLPIKFIFQGMVSHKDVVIIGIVQDVVRRELGRNMGVLFPVYVNLQRQQRYISSRSRAEGRN